jgi:hypothetical protein
MRSFAIRDEARHRCSGRYEGEVVGGCLRSMKSGAACRNPIKPGTLMPESEEPGTRMPEKADLWQEGAAKQGNPAGECGKAAESRTLLKRSCQETERGLHG